MEEGENKYTLQDYRTMLDLMQDEDVEWTPYNMSIRLILPPACMAGHKYWLSIAPLIDFSIVETYHPNRVMSQFSKIQVILPPARSTLHDINKVDRQKHPTKDWLEYHHEHVAAWNDRKRLIVDETRPYDHRLHLAYMEWYNTATISIFATYIGISVDRALVGERLGRPKARIIELVRIQLLVLYWHNKKKLLVLQFFY